MLAEHVQEAGSGRALTPCPQNDRQILTLKAIAQETSAQGQQPAGLLSRGSGAEVREDASSRVAVVQNGGTEQHYLIQSSWLRVQASGGMTCLRILALSFPVLLCCLRPVTYICGLFSCLL